ncbi:MAG: hypothetical protein A2V67_08050 [Deltaproteobacteria bacterium RBG_13_61_14]|nr:MAG: hypothetical protein A2V67_08050 [Deltaproteobacteria bacterium RBG_13_61_14]
MSVKAVEMVRKIRDQIYEEIKDLSVEEQMEFYRKGSEELQKLLKKKGMAEEASKKTSQEDGKQKSEISARERKAP